jgi:hypothetical protein
MMANVSVRLPAGRSNDRSLQHRAARIALVVAIIAGALVRLNLVSWVDPWSPHHADEHVLPLEALALWEGVTPVELGWPGSTARITLSGIAAVQFLVEQGRVVLRQAGEPAQVLETVSKWIGERYVESSRLYRLGRSVSVVVGIAQLIVVAWALRQWLGPTGAAIGTLASAIAPIAVAYSQYVLADVFGLFLSTIVVGLAARPTVPRLIVMGALAALAMASKFHFGLWLLTPLLCVWLRLDDDPARKRWIALSVVGIFVWVFVTMVPWLWINPLLPLKEFLATVVAKVGTGAPRSRFASNIEIVVGPLGLLTWLGAVLRFTFVRRNDARRLVPLLVPVLLGLTVFAVSDILFDRWGLVLMPGLVVLAAEAWEWLSTHERPLIRVTGTTVLVAAIAATAVSLVRNQRVVGEIDVDVAARRWILANVSRGKRVAIHDEDNAFLPRTAAQLRHCAEYVETEAAYREKWKTESLKSPEAGEPMSAMVLNDERFHAFWCRRELETQRDPGFWLVAFNPDARVDRTLERDAITEFRTGSTELTGGVDVLVTNRAVDSGASPVQVFRTARGERYIYAR